MRYALECFKNFKNFRFLFLSRYILYVEISIKTKSNLRLNSLLYSNIWNDTIAFQDLGDIEKLNIDVIFIVLNMNWLSDNNYL